MATTCTWDTKAAAAHAISHANAGSLGRCAQYTREAIEAGGITLERHNSAKDYGSSLIDAGFRPLLFSTKCYQVGDVVIIQPIPGHPDGHMAIYDGRRWISDFVQLHGFYPWPIYRAQKPSFAVYRFSASTSK